MPTKARAYAEQARDDFDGFQAAARQSPPVLRPNHLLQLLQMALEKMSKAFLYHAEPDALYRHAVVRAAVNRLRTHVVAEACGQRLSTFTRELNIALPILLQIEAASPSVGPDGRALTREESERTENVEYPWKVRATDPASWVAPASHSFSVIRRLRRDRNAWRAVALTDRLIDAAAIVLPMA